MRRPGRLAQAALLSAVVATCALAQERNLVEAGKRIADVKKTVAEALRTQAKALVAEMDKLAKDSKAAHFKARTIERKGIEAIEAYIKAGAWSGWDCSADIRAVKGKVATAHIRAAKHYLERICATKETVFTNPSSEERDYNRMEDAFACATEFGAGQTSIKLMRSQARKALGAAYKREAAKYKARAERTKSARAKQRVMGRLWNALNKEKAFRGPGRPSGSRKGPPLKMHSRALKTRYAILAAGVLGGGPRARVLLACRQDILNALRQHEMTKKAARRWQERLEPLYWYTVSHGTIIRVEQNAHGSVVSAVIVWNAPRLRRRCELPGRQKVIRSDFGPFCGGRIRSFRLAGGRLLMRVDGRATGVMQALATQRAKAASSADAKRAPAEMNLNRDAQPHQDVSLEFAFAHAGLFQGWRLLHIAVINRSD